MAKVAYWDGSKLNHREEAGGGGGGGMWTYVETLNFPTASNGATFVTTLDGNIDEYYRILGTVKAGAVGDRLLVRPNNDGNSANYHTGLIYNASWWKGSYSGLDMSYINAGDTIYYDMIICAKSGMPRLIDGSIIEVNGNAIDYNEKSASIWRNTTDNITSLVLATMDGGNAIGAGSKFRLYKKSAD